MDTNHSELFLKISLIDILASEAIAFFNQDQGLPIEKIRNGLRICFTDQQTGEDVLHMCVGSFPVEKSERYFDFSRKKAKYVSGGNEAPLATDGKEIPKGGVRGFLYGVGVSGQLPPHDRAIAGAIIFIVEKNLDYWTYKSMLKPFVSEHILKLKEMFDAEELEGEDSFDRLMNHLVNTKKIFEEPGFSELVKNL